MGQHYFAVIRLNKSKIIFLGIIGVLIMTLLIFITGSFLSLGFGERELKYSIINFERVLTDEQVIEEIHPLFPKHFIAGGISYDNSILGQHGIEALADNKLNHFDEVGIYTIKAEVKKIKYFEKDRKVQITVIPQESGFNLISFNKGFLREGPITYEFINIQGERITIEEDFIYSIPIEFVILKEGDLNVAPSPLNRFVIVDSEIKPVLASYGFDTEILQKVTGDNISLYVFGGEILTVQKQGESLRIYFNDSEGYQVVKFSTERFPDGHNIVKLIREKDLRLIETMSFWKNN